MPEQITLYTSSASPYSHAVEIALVEANANFKKFEFDLKNKPAWFVSKVNPVGQIPAITYGGPDVPPDQPSPDSVKLRESTVLLEFIAELFPGAGLLPKDLVLRAKARLFLEISKSKLFPAWFGNFRKGEPIENLFAILEHLQAMLPPTGFVVGGYSIADAYIASILSRADIIFENNINTNGWPDDEGARILETLRGPRFVRLAQYKQDLFERPSFKSTFDKAALTEKYKGYFGPQPY
ncbi:glutathione S-transferase C-terminal-like protein [Obba rivulosa]|uniref:Glutathione S-transferase C-terminal-like protein n=1 Tax=Obba rivulosa TaxID=1052685 RepID=A0A8E2DDH9_9APHY|nr:glutathione S-transferase C-terminal-like protein [Obba rivulosa]